MHLEHDLAHAGAPHMSPLDADTGWYALPWLWTNAIVGLGLALTAYRRSYRTE